VPARRKGCPAAVQSGCPRALAWALHYVGAGTVSQFRAYLTLGKEQVTMSTRLSTPHLSQDRLDDGEDYVLIDARAVLLDLADEPDAPAVRPVRRGVQPPPVATTCNPEIEWRAFLGAARRDVVSEEAASMSLWRRVTRRWQGVWGGARGSAGHGQ
jgi:hypothetical protein